MDKALVVCYSSMRTFPAALVAAAVPAGEAAGAFVVR